MDTEDESLNTDSRLKEYRKSNRGKVLDSTTTPVLSPSRSTIELDIDAILYCTQQRSAV